MAGRARPTTRQNVMENRARMARALGVAPEHLVTVHQVHSPDALVVEGPWPGERPKADGMVTRTPGVALAVAQCRLRSRAVRRRRRPASSARAIPAGKARLPECWRARWKPWRRLGADRARIVAVLGPTISGAAYEVGPEFVARFTSEDAALARFFKPSPREGHAWFDLPGFIGTRLRQGRHRPFHQSGPVHLFRPGAFLQLPSDDPSRRTGLWPPGVRDHASGLNARRVLTSRRYRAYASRYAGRHRLRSSGR